MTQSEPRVCDCKTVEVKGEMIHEMTCSLFDGLPLNTAAERIERRNNLIALINTWNEATNPSVPRTDAEHEVERKRARIALGSIKRNYRLGVDYKELSNGALWPLDADGGAYPTPGVR